MNILTGDYFARLKKTPKIILADNTAYTMSTETHESAMSGNKGPVSEDVYEQPQDFSDSQELDEIDPSEFSQENIERIYR